MSDRLSPMDVSFLYLEESTTPMHVGGVGIFQPPEDGFDYDRLTELIKERIGLVPRYRQKIRMVPGRLANPVWVDDPDFDITYHVRRSALPKPGTYDQLKELMGRVESRPLDRTRPLWELYLVEGLEGGKIAIITKTHHVMVHGITSIAITSVLFDITPEPRATPSQPWEPAPVPSAVRLVGGAVADLVRRPAELVESARAGVVAGVTDARRFLGGLTRELGGLAAAARTQAHPTPSSPLNVPIGEQRRYGMARTEVDDYKRVRKAHGGTVNDVVLATVSGALRTWLLTRGEPVTSTTTLRAMVPVSVRGPNDKAQGNHVSSYFVDLPIGEPDPVVRLQHVIYAMAAHKHSNQAVGAQAIIGLAGFAPPTIHALAARVGSSLSRRIFNLVVTNVPGPQFPLYAAGARMLEMYPVVPLAKGQTASIGLTSYDGGVYYGLLADRDAMPDVDVLGQCIEEALVELVDTVH